MSLDVSKDDKSINRGSGGGCGGGSGGGCGGGRGGGSGGGSGGGGSRVGELTSGGDEQVDKQQAAFLWDFLLSGLQPQDAVHVYGSSSHFNKTILENLSHVCSETYG